MSMTTELDEISADRSKNYRPTSPKMSSTPMTRGMNGSIDHQQTQRIQYSSSSAGPTTFAFPSGIKWVAKRSERLRSEPLAALACDWRELARGLTPTKEKPKSAEMWFLAAASPAANY